jgi:hypothetical protein
MMASGSGLVLGCQFNHMHIAFPIWKVNCLGVILKLD